MAKKTKSEKGVTPKLSAAMIDHARRKAIEAACQKHGPVYVRALVPNYAKRDFENNAYSAWYIGHLDEKFLEDEQVNSYISEFDGSWTDDGIAPFIDFLETKGYIVFSSSFEDGVIVLDVPDKED